MKNNYEVVVSNIGQVHQSANKKESLYLFRLWVNLSKETFGRAQGESITLFANDEVLNEYAGINEFEGE